MCRIFSQLMTSTKQKLLFGGSGLTFSLSRNEVTEEVNGDRFVPRKVGLALDSQEPIALRFAPQLCSHFSSIDLYWNTLLHHIDWTTSKRGFNN